MEETMPSSKELAEANLDKRAEESMDQTKGVKREGGVVEETPPLKLTRIDQTTPVETEDCILKIAALESQEIENTLDQLSDFAESELDSGQEIRNTLGQLSDSAEVELENEEILNDFIESSMVVELNSQESLDRLLESPECSEEELSLQILTQECPEAKSGSLACPEAEITCQEVDKKPSNQSVDTSNSGLQSPDFIKIGLETIKEEDDDDDSSSKELKINELFDSPEFMSQEFSEESYKPVFETPDYVKVGMSDSALGGPSRQPTVTSAVVKDAIDVQEVDKQAIMTETPYLTIQEYAKRSSQKLPFVTPDFSNAGLGSWEFAKENTSKGLFEPQWFETSRQGSPKELSEEPQGFLHVGYGQQELARERASKRYPQDYIRIEFGNQEISKERSLRPPNFAFGLDNTDEESQKKSKGKSKRKFIAQPFVKAGRGQELSLEGSLKPQPMRVGFPTSGFETQEFDNQPSNRESESIDNSINISQGPSEDQRNPQRVNIEASMGLSTYQQELSLVQCVSINSFKQSMLETAFGRFVLIIRPWLSKASNIHASFQVARIQIRTTYIDRIYTMLAGKKVLAVGHGENKQHAKQTAEVLAWDRLTTQVVSMIVKEQWIAHGDTRIGLGDITDRNQDDEGFGTPMERGVAAKMMEMMGWKGGGLGADGQGIFEPVKPNLHRVHRAGLGSITTNTRSFKRLMERFKHSPSVDVDLVFSSDFNKNERAALHQMAQRQGLVSRSYGPATDRFLVIRKRHNPFGLVMDVIEAGGNTAKYQVYLPTFLTTTMSNADITQQADSSATQDRSDSDTNSSSYYEPHGLSSSMYEPRAHSSRTNEPQAHSSRTNEPQAHSSRTNEPQAHSSRTNEPRAHSSRTNEPQAHSSRTNEPQAHSSRTNEPRAHSSRTNEPQAHSSRTNEPQAHSSRTNEPQAHSSRTNEPQAHSSRTNEPRAHSSRTNEPQAHSSRTNEPQAHSSRTNEPRAHSSCTNEPRAHSSRTNEPQAHSSRTNEPRAHSSRMYEPRAQFPRLYEPRPHYSKMYEPQAHSSRIYEPRPQPFYEPRPPPFYQPRSHPANIYAPQAHSSRIYEPPTSYYEPEAQSRMYERQAQSYYEPRPQSSGSMYEPRPHSSGSMYEPRAHSSASMYEPRAHLSGSRYEPHAHSLSSMYEPHAHSSGSMYEPRAHSSGSMYEPPAHSSGSMYEPRAPPPQSFYDPLATYNPQSQSSSKPDDDQSRQTPRSPAYPGFRFYTP